MSTIKLWPYALLALSPCVLAQQPPTAGSQLQQIPPAPTPQKAAPKLEVVPLGMPTVPTAGTEASIVVSRLSVSGMQVYPEADLLAITAFTPGSELTLTDLRGMAARIADFYHRNGYFVAQAYLPAQDIKDGAVTIAVIEGRYGQVTLQNSSNLSNNLANNILGGLNTGDLVQAEPLERRLLLLSDVPGINVRSTLVPGVEPGSSNLIVDVTPGPRISGEVDADNAGNRYTGEYRVGATVNVNNLTGNGDVASLRAMTSGSGLNYARASYQMQFGVATAGVAYSWLDYTLGREFASTGGTGTAQVASIYGTYPLVRSRSDNLSAGLAFDARTFQDKTPLDLTLPVTDKRAHVLMASLYGDHRDNFGRGGVSAYSFIWSLGNLDIQTPEALARDAVAKTNGHYDKLAFSAMRLQSLTESVSLYGAINGQVASKNLDPSEKMELGGMYAVRAYPEGEAYGDEGYVATLEGRLQLPKLYEEMPGQMQFIGFVDYGHVTLSTNPWIAGSNSRTLSGIGVGLTWAETNNFSIRTYYAVKLGSEPATSAPDKSGRFWIQLVKYF